MRLKAELRLYKAVSRKCLEKKEAAARCVAAAMTTSRSKNPSLHAAADVATQEFRNAIAAEKTMRGMVERHCRYAAALRAQQTEDILATETSILSLDDWTALMFDVQSFESVEAISAFVSALDLDVNETSRDGTTPLMVAAIEQRVDVVQLLLERGAKIDAVTINGWTALMFAAGKSNPYVAVQLLAAKSGPCGAVQLLGTAEYINRASARGMTAMMRAAYNGHSEIIEMLVECGGNVNAVDCDGKTALMFAAMHAHYDAVVTLIAHGAAIDAVTRDGLTAFHYAAANNCPTEFLILPAAETARVLLPQFSDDGEEVVD